MSDSNNNASSNNASIPAEAQAHVRRNFVLLASSHAASNLGDHLANPKTVLAWLLGAVGAPAALVAVIVPIRESGSMVLQVFIASIVRRLRYRKFAWVVGSMLQALTVAGIGLTALFLEGPWAGALIVLCVLLFSVSRGLNSVASKDVMGRTIPKGRRGRVSGLGASLSGVVAALLGAYVWSTSDGVSSVRTGAGLVFVAAVLWLVSGSVYASVREPAGEVHRDKDVWRSAINRLGLLRTDRTFRRFTLARAMLLCSALSAPYFMILAQERLDVNLRTLGSFMLANAIASSVSATIWGWLADRSSRRVLIAAGAMSSVLGVLMAWVGHFDTPLSGLFWTYPAVFFLLGIAHNGVRLGRKTYVVDMAEGDRRTDYVSAGNTVIGLLLLLTALLTPLASILTPAGMLLLLSILGLAGSVMASRLPEVQ